MYKRILFVLLILLWVVPSLAQAIEMNPDSIPFAPPLIYSMGGDLVSVFCTDLDGDNDIDLAMVEHNWPGIIVMMNSGEGTFLSSGGAYTGGDPTSIFCADVNGDGYPDLIVTCNSFV